MYFLCFQILICWGGGYERAGGKVPPTPPNQDMVLVVVILGTKNRRFFVGTIFKSRNESELSFLDLKIVRPFPLARKRKPKMTRSLRIPLYKSFLRSFFSKKRPLSYSSLVLRLPDKSKFEPLSSPKNKNSQFHRCNIKKVVI